MRLTCGSSKVKKVDRTWKFVVFWDDIAHCREHCHPAVLDLNCSASSECGCICVGVQSEGIPVTDGCLHTKVSGGDGCWRRGSRLGATKGSGAHSSINGSSTSLEQHILRGCTERRISVVGPIAPCRSGQTSGQLTSTRTLHSEPQRTAANHKSSVTSPNSETTRDIYNILQHICSATVQYASNMFQHAPKWFNWRVAPNPTFAHTQRTHPNNIIYLSSEDEWKHWLYAAILTLGFSDLGF